MSFFSLPPRARSVFAAIGVFGLFEFHSLARGHEREQRERPVSVFDLSLEDLAAIRVVTAASGYAQDALRAPASVSVVQASEWQARGARDLLTAIRPITGVYVGRAQTSGPRDTLFLRGLSGTFGQQVLTLVDGQSVTDPFYGGLRTSSRFPLLGIKRIEVVRGPGSAVYGADALAGVVNMVSYQPGEMPSQFVVRYGDFERYDLGVTHEWHRGEGTLQVAYEYQHGDDDPDKRVGADLQSTLDSLFGTKASLAPGRIDDHYSISNLHLKGQWRTVNVALFDLRNLGSGMGAGNAQALDPTGVHRHSVTQFDLGVDIPDHVPGLLSFHFTQRFDRETNSFRLLPPGTVAPIGADGNLDFLAPRNLVLFTDGLIGEPDGSWSLSTAKVTHVLDLADRHRLRWEIGHQWIQLRVQERKNFGPGVLDGSQKVVDGRLTDVTGTPYVSFPNSRRRVFNVSLQDEFAVTSDLSATLGVRHDEYSDFGGTTNPRLGVSYFLSKDIVLRASAGTAFRAPSFVELYPVNNPVGLGNPNLRPETVETGDLGLSFVLPFAPKIQWETSVFAYRAKRLIRFVETEQPGNQVATNIGTHEGQGFEVGGRWQWQADWSVDFNYSWVSTENEAGWQTPDVPRQLFNVGMTYSPASSYRVYVGAKSVSDRARSPGDGRPPIADFVLGTARVEKTFDRLTVGLTLDNLFNDDIRLPSYGAVPDDYPQEGFNWMLEATWRF